MGAWQGSAELSRMLSAFALGVEFPVVCIPSGDQEQGM